MDDFFKDMRILEAFYVFIGFAILFALLGSYSDIRIPILYAIIPAAIVIIANGVKLIWEEYL
jgi:hypothetical protein